MNENELLEKMNDLENSLEQQYQDRLEEIAEAGKQLRAEWLIGVLTEHIDEFYESLPPGKELQMKIPGYGQIKPRSVMSDGSETLVIKGDVEGHGRAVIIQNISQISFGLIEADRPDNDERATKKPEIGFLKD